MSLLVVGSVAFDSVKTPFGEREEILGGSATYFSTAASYFTSVNLVAVVGDDFPDQHINFLKGRGVNTEGLERQAGKTFRWKGEYGYQLNEANTLETHLNVFESFRPTIPESYRDSEVVFLANIDPELQSDVLRQVNSPRIIACDTMNFWISGKRDALLNTLKNVDILIINDGEARQLAQEANLVKAASVIMSYGPKHVIVKRGEYGALMFNSKNVFAAPAYPLENVFDPTGAGDSFAGGFLGFLSSTRNFNEENMRQAVIFGSVMASFVVEDFSLNRIRELNYDEILNRYREFKRLTHFEDAGEIFNR
ncbi:MAG TPA: PfkB family carbohydrate kinase [Nitrospirota bacterium]|nr:PfkB family carbohydrate kinase [Nitrospirota bacterium]